MSKLQEIENIIWKYAKGEHDGAVTADLAARAVLQALREPGAKILAAEGVHTNCHTCGGHLEGFQTILDAVLAEDTP